MTLRSISFAASVAVFVGLVTGTSAAADVRAEDEVAASASSDKGSTSSKAPTLAPRQNHRGKDLRGHHQPGAKLHHSDLRRVNLHHANLHHAKIHHADLRAANLRHATLHKADFSRSKLHRSDFSHAGMRYADFSGATLHRARFRRAIAHHSDFTGVKARKAHFSHARLRQATMSGGKFAGSLFRHAKLQGADFSRKASGVAATVPACGSACTGANLRGTDFTGANLSGANLSGADLNHARLRNADLRGADFTGADLRGADLLSAKIKGANFHGAITAGALFTPGSLPVTASNSTFCSMNHVPTDTPTALVGGVVLASFSAMSGDGTGTAVIEGPGGVMLEASFTCDQAQPIRQGARWVFPFTLKVAGSRGTHTSPLTGLTVDTSSFEGTITRDTSGQVDWDVTADMEYVLGDFTIFGDYRVSSSTEWELDVTGGQGSIDTADGTFTGNSFDGSVLYADGKIHGEMQIVASGSHAWLEALPAAWNKRIVFQIDFRTSGSSIVVMPSLVLTGTSSSNGNVSSIKMTAQVPGGSPEQWAERGLRFTGDGTVYLRNSPVTVSGWYQSAGYEGQPDPTWDISGAVSDVPLRGMMIEAGTIEMTSDAPGIYGTVDIQVTKKSSFVFDATLAYTDSSNWVLTATGGGSTSWSPTPGLTIPAQAFNGTISVKNGVLHWQIAVGSESEPLEWTGVAAGVHINAWYTLTPQCDLPDCDLADGPYLTSHDGTVSFTSTSLTVNTSGALRADGKWAVFNASVPTEQSFTGPHGTSLTLGNPTLTVWKGDAPHDEAPGLSMPDVNTSGDGLGVQFCGTFAASDLPYIGSVPDVPGCVSWSPNGIAFGLSHLGVSTPGGTATATDSDSSVSGVSLGATSFAGLGWTNLSTRPVISVGSEQLELLKGSTSLSGSVTLPGELMQAFGKQPTPVVLPATATFSDPSWTVEDASFDMTAALPLNYSSNGFTLDDIEIQVGKSGPTWSFGLGVDATYKINGTQAPVVMSLGYNEGEIALELVATGTGADDDDCNCDGIQGAFQTPQDYRYLTDSFMSVPGMHLWSITGRLIVVDGEPGFGLGATVYQDPSKMSTIMHGSTWMQGKFYVNVDLLDPCLDFGFTSPDPNTYLQVKGGVLRTSTFDISVAPARGCTVGSDQIPGGVAVNFNAAFGSAGYFDFSLAFDPAAEIFYEKVDIGNVTMGGIDFVNGDLIIDLEPSSQNVNFDTDFTLPPAGKFTSNFALRINSASHMQMDGAVSVTDWDMAGGTFDVQNLSYQMSFDTDAGTFNSNASGAMKFSAKSNIAFTAVIAYSNNALQQFDFDFDYTHGNVGYDYKLDYNAATHTLSGGIALDYEKRTSHRFTSGGHNYVRHAYITISLDYSMNTNNPSQAWLTIAFSGSSSDGDLKVSGSATLSSTPGVDDSASAKLHVHIGGMGSWDDSWTW